MILDENNQLGAYLCTLSTLAINIAPQVNRIVHHFKNYPLISRKENVIDTDILSKYFDNV